MNITKIFQIKNFTDFLQIYYCQEARHLNKTESIALVFNYEQNQPCQKTYEEYMQEVTDIDAIIYSSNEILNPFNFNDPIQTVLDDKHTLKMDPRVKSLYRFYVQK